MLNKKPFVTTMIAIIFAFQMAGCGSQATPVPEPATHANPTIAPTSKPEIAATASPKPPPALDLVWEITGDPNPFNAPVGVTVDQDGNVYVMDSQNNRVQKFDRNGDFISMWGSQGDGEGQFQNASSRGWVGRMAVDTQGNIYVLDVYNFRIQKFDSSGNYQSQSGARGTGDGEFSLFPFDIAVDAQDNVYVCESGAAHRVQKFDANGKFLLAWGQLGYKDGEFSQGDTCTLAIDPTGNVLVADNSGRIQKFDASGHFLSKLILPPINNISVSPWNIAVDNRGNIYVGDAAQALIAKLDSEGQVLASWNIGEATATDIQDIAVDAEGNIYTSDPVNNTVKKFRQN